MKCKLAAIAIAVALLAGTATAAFAEVSGPPQPPPPPDCKSCSGPPPPPTPVPTVAPTLVPAQPLIEIKLTTPKLARGQTAKVSIDASTDDVVTVVVRYYKAKPKTYHAKVGSSGSIAQTWKIPKNAPRGKATITVTVESSDTKVSKNFSLVVTS